jgi:hypothetical protein
MGERVVVGPATPVEPIDDSGGGGGGTAPLNYGRGGRAGDRWRVARAWLGVFFDSVKRLAVLFVEVLGGWRRVFFAIGLGSLLGGIGDCLSGFSRSDGAFWMFIGGLLIGLTVRVPLRGSDS